MEGLGAKVAKNGINCRTRATDALIPFDDLKKWPHQQIDSNAQKDLCRAIFWVQRFSQDSKYQEAETRFHCPQTLESYFIKHES